METNTNFTMKLINLIEKTFKEFLNLPQDTYSPRVMYFTNEPIILEHQYPFGSFELSKSTRYE